MKKQFKKLLCASLSIAMIAGSIVLPMSASADTTPIFDGDTVLKEWKFDFGAEGATPDDGYTLVTPDTSFVTNKVNGEQYGFLGIGEEDYKLSERYDGWFTQKGQIIELAAGGTSENDAVGVVGAGGEGEYAGKDIFGNKADIYYPTRFALKVPDETYYRVKATVTTLDPTKDATVSLYTERKHPLYTAKTIEAGTTYTETFSVRVTPIYYQKSDPQGVIADEMLTVGVLGENSALVSVEIQQVESFPTLWVLGDSTVTDGKASLPFFLLQNYTGVGTGLSKYLRRDYAVVNEGEGGLNASDSLHYNVVKDRIKAGDYMYVEYGHNHKDDGAAGYKSNLGKYYDTCHSVGAKLLIVSPVQSVNSWNGTKWTDRFGPSTDASTFAGAGRTFVEEKIAAGATDIAFVNLTKTSVAFVDKVTTDHNNEKKAAQFYYWADKSGGTDASHPNDAGADNFAHCFFEAAQEVTDATQAAVIANLIADMTGEEPTPIAEEIMAGKLGGDAWPQYIVPTDEKYPVLIKDITFNDNGTVKQVDVVTRAAEITLSSYGIIIITVYKEDGTEKGKIYAVDQVDNSTGYGSQTIFNFRTEPTGLVLEEGDTYDAIVVEAEDSNEGLKVVEGGKIYSAVYKPTDIAEHLILNEDENSNENFRYFGATYDGETDQLSGKNGWRQIGSAGITSYLNESGDIKYVEFASTGKKGDGGNGSFYYDKALAREIGTTGRYLISADLQYVSGSGMSFNLVNGHSDRVLGGSESQYLFTVGADGKITASGNVEAGIISATSFTNVQAILDMDLGTLEITVSGNDPVTINLANYQTTSLEVKPTKLTQFMFGASSGTAFGTKVANLTVAKMKEKQLPEYTATVAASDDAHGTVSISEAGSAPVESGYTLSYANGKAVVTADKAGSATLIEAKYTGKKLIEVKSTPLTFAAAGTEEVAATEGSKLMLWDSLDGMEPLAAAITAEETDNDDENSITAPLNTVITVKAEAIEGYAFMGWLDEEGKTVSMDATYTFRLRDDIKLTANFVKEPGVEDVVSFALEADKMRINATVAGTVNLNIVDAKDAAGTPLSKVTNADAVWSCDDSAITVTDGVLTIPEGYDAGEAKKTVTVTATLNEDIHATIKLVLYSSKYYEDFSTVASVSEWMTDNSAKTLSEILDTSSDNSFAGMSKVKNGKVFVIGNGSNAAGSNISYERDMALSEHSVLKFGFEIEPHQIRTDGKNAGVNLRFVDTAGATVMDIYVHTGGKNSSFNGTEISGFVNGTAVAVDTELDFNAGTMKYTLTDASGKQLTTGTANITATNLAKMAYTGDWQYGKFAIDNIYADWE